MNSIILNLKRTFRLQSSLQLWLFSTISSFLASLFIFFAFVHYGEGVADFKYYFFFFTIYSFWIGLLGSCQTFSGMHESGEWKYWTLGFKQSFTKVFCGVFSANLAINFMQFLVFLGFSLLFLFIGYEDFFPAYTGNLALIISGNGSHFVLMRIAGMFLGGFLALLCGCASGIYLSILFNSSASVKVAICIILLLLTTSSPVLTLGLKVECYPVFMQLTLGHDCKNEWEGKKGREYLSKISYFLPQRYFFNASYIADGEYIESLFKKNTPNEIKEIKEKYPEKNSWAQKLFAQGDKKFYETAVSGGKKVFSAEKYQKIKSIWIPYVLMTYALEVGICLLIFAIILILSILTLNLKKKYYELR